jgi:DNA (cytosine-5)-methyltransferase 1
MRVLNLYAGLGGNRMHWKDCEVTAVEWDPKIAEVYRRQYPQDELVIGDAHDYLLAHSRDFDFIWSSPPCQSHSRMIRSGQNRRPRYPDMKLYEEILFLTHSYKGKWVVENVVPYYDVLIPATKVGRHLFWTNFDIQVEDVKRPKGFIKPDLTNKQALMDWLGIHYEENIYYGNNHCPAQILRNCVHPLVGKQIFEQVQQHIQGREYA